MQDLYEKQEDGQWAGDGLLIIRRLGERFSQVFGSGEPSLLPYMLYILRFLTTGKGTQYI